MIDTNKLKELIIEGIQERKGHNITIVDLSQIETSIAENFIICEGTSTMQVSAIADSIREYVQEHGNIKPYNYDGYRVSQWIVIDYGSIIVHVFLHDERLHYNLEGLWSDATLTEIPDIY